MKLKLLLSTFLLSAVSLTICAQTTAPRLIVRADDMGSSNSADRANTAVIEKGYVTSIEVMAVAPWFPEAARTLREHPGMDVGLHFVITSEWDNIKWRPLTHCPNLVDKNGYFLPMMAANPNYPGLAITENKWNLQEIEQELRAQIELALKNVPHISHISGHMGSCSFAPEVEAMVTRVAKEYHLGFIERTGADEAYNLSGVGYFGASATPAEKEASFLKTLDTLQRGRTYLFVDHPAYDDAEMQAVHHIGYENVAKDRQGVTELFTSDKVKQALQTKGIQTISYNQLLTSLPRSTKADKKMDKAFDNYWAAIEKAEGMDIHSTMILQHGKVIAEKWRGEHNPNELHVLNSVSKTFTCMAVGFAVSEGKIKVTDKVIDFFPDKLPANISDNLKAMEIKDLLTMSCGHDTDPTSNSRKENEDWVKAFLAVPVEHKPGTFYCYNSLGTYMLCAIVQKVTGEKVVDYLRPRLFRPLGIAGVTWQESPQGINCGGWGLYVRTEDLAKLGQFILQKGQWNGEQLMPAAWIDEASTSHIASLPAGSRPETITIKPKDSDWLQGYGYQMWRCRHNAFRADGANGQYIIMLPEKDAVIAVTADVRNMQAELNLIWKYLLPAL